MFARSHVVDSGACAGPRASRDRCSKPSGPIVVGAYSDGRAALRRLPGAAAALAIAVLGLTATTAGATPIYAINATSESVSPFALQTDGTLLPIACSPLSNCETGGEGGLPLYAAVDPSGRFLYNSNANENRISVYAIAADGSPSRLKCEPGSCKTGKEPRVIAVDPLGRFLFSVNEGADSVSPFTIKADGTLSPIACSGKGCETPEESEPSGLAIAPSGNFLYVTNFKKNTVSIFAIAADGSLSKVACKPSSNCATGFAPDAIAVSPDGQHLYVTNVDSSEEDISVFAINADGTLVPTCDPATSCRRGGKGPVYIAISPDGRLLYTSNESSHDVSPYAIAADGSLTPIACAPANCSTGANAEGISFAPSGRFLYAGGLNRLVPFAIGADGSPTPVSCPINCATGSGPAGVAAAPDQGPVAALAATVAPATVTTTLDASASTDADGQIARYDWQLGDGTMLSTSVPTLQHAYAAPGSYTVRVTATDDAGCSTAQTFTGQTASCNGTAAATTVLAITVPPAPPAPPAPLIAPAPLAPTISHFAQSAKRWREGAALATISRSHAHPVGTTFSFGLDRAASVRLTFVRPAAGRSVAGSCVAPTPHNIHKRRCTRRLTAGVLTLAGHAGADRIRFAGRVSRSRRLKPGAYTVTILATAAGLRSTAASLRFEIVTH